MLAVSLSGTCSAEIPHENYDLVSSDLEMVISLLNASIRASEEALLDMASEDVVSAEQSLALIDTALAPASALVGQMTGVAGSYEDLSVLLPPFTDLYEQMEGFAAMEVDLLETRDLVLELSRLQNMTDEQTNEAMIAVAEFSSMIAVMREMTDSMLAHASRIDGLTVDDMRPFVPNDLGELIEDLEEFLSRLEQQVEDAVHDDIPWQEDISFLLIWLAKDRVFLGDSLAGGGYLYSDSVFVEGVAVTLLIDGSPMIYLTTGGGGSFSFTFDIPVEESWLGGHTIAGLAAVLTGDLSSDTLTFTVTLVPTVTTIDVPMTELSPTDLVDATVQVMDGRGMPLASVECVLTVDDSDIGLVTGESGSVGWSRTASELGYGNHTLSAAYGGGLPYAPSVSRTVWISITISTSLNLTLLSDRLTKDDYLLGRCTLVSNDSTPMPGRHVSMYMDDVLINNHTTDENGSFAFSHRTTGISAGSHVLSVAYEAEGVQWRNASDSEIFTVITYEKAKYPFFPWIPDWGMGFVDEIPDLFFGEHAYYTWLLILLVVGLAMRALTVRRSKREARDLDAERRRAYEDMRARNGLSMGGAKAPSSLLDRFGEEPDMPHDSVIWHYSRLVDFLRRRRRVALAGSMTHWEIARLLMAIGYPRQATNKVTMLFERAFYSGSGVSGEDADQMRSSVREIMDHAGGAGSAH